VKFAIRDTKGNDIALFDTYIDMDQWMMGKLQSGELKFGQFVYCELDNSETKTILCPSCGTQIRQG